MTTETGIGRGCPRVSVVVPSYNQGRFIGEALDSILGQGYPDLEVLVMDGGSTDETLEILKGYGDRIRFESGRDGGQADALNRGFAKATGEIVGWLNSDDRYCPGAIEKGVATLEAEPETGFVYGEGELIAEDGRVLCRFPATRPFDLWVLSRVSDFIMQPTVFMRSEALEEVGGLDPSLCYAMDWDLWIRMAVRRPVARCPDVLAQTREYGRSKTAGGGFGRWRELRRVLARHGAGSWSPAAICYGLDTLRRKWPGIFGPSSAGDIEERKGRRVAELLAPVHRVTTRLIERELRHAQGIWIDRWTADRAFMAVSWMGGDAILTVTGDVPAPPSHFPLELTMKAADRLAKVEVVARGDFSIELSLRADGKEPRPLEVELRASRVFRADRDPRRLAFRIESLRLEESGRVHWVRPIQG